MSARAMMDPKKLRDHPINKELYGPVELSQGFLDSIAENGVLQNLIVMHRDGTYFVVSGHRRRDAATMLGIEEVPVEVRDYESLEAAESDLIALNMFREKTDQVYAREGEQLMEIYGREAEARMKAGVPVSGGQTGGRTDDLVAEALGISRNRLRNVITVFGDLYRDKQLAEHVRAKAQPAVLATWNRIREDRLADKMPLTAAATAVQGLLKTAGKEASERPTIRKPTWGMKWRPVPEGTVPAVFATRMIDPDTDTYVKFADIDGQVCLLVGKQMAPIDIEYIKYLHKEK